MTALFDRHAEPQVRQLLQHFPCVMIEGARQVGKSTLARQIAGDESRVFTLDDADVRAAVERDPVGFLERQGDDLLVIDEFQRLPHLVLPLKAAIDRDRRPGRFLLTGSASLLNVRGLPDSLAGRMVSLPLYGLSAGESMRRRDDFVATLLADSRPEAFETALRRSDYARLIEQGGYPEAKALPERLRRTWLTSYVERVTHRDLGELRREVSPDRADSLLRALAGNQAGELVKARLAGATTIPVATITGYLDLLRATHLIATIPPWTPNLGKREVGRHKAIVLDSALGLHLARLTAAHLDQLSYSEAFGSFLEAFVVAELLKQQSWAAEEFKVFRYRDRAGGEIDVILELAGGAVIAIEVKASTSFSAGHFKHLDALRAKLGDRFLAGVVLNTGTQGYQYADRLYGLPVSALWQW
ncbi:MAG: ATP-binding protein [Aeromicrobium sp.]|uniref:ATP-binding protein n=1 Tax=Aeromicrobium sp. TaxID=1871063 RepID=UPI0039E3230E